MRTVKEAVGDSCISVPGGNPPIYQADPGGNRRAGRFEPPDFWVSTAPFYHAMSQKDLLAHYETIAKHISAPLIVYISPPPPITISNWIRWQSFPQLDQVAAVKDSSGNFINFSRGLLGPRSDKFAWIQGEDYLCAPARCAAATAWFPGCPTRGWSHMSPCTGLMKTRIGIWYGIARLK